MLARSLFIVAAVALAAVLVPRIAESYLANAPMTKSSEPAVSAAGQAAPPARYTGTRGTTLQADARGHFFGVFTINGRKERGMIDTGASSVAINLSIAQRLGFARKDLDFRHVVDTANGKVRAAAVRLDSVEIGGVRVANVGAMVLEDKSLSGMLVGMTFLRGLSSYQVDGNQMRLIR